MESIRVDIAYRPLRVCWAIQDGDKDAFRSAVRQSHALWGGRFHPIVVVDRPEEAKQIIEVFQVDVVMPLGKSTLVKDFVTRFSHLSKPFYTDGIFVKDGREGKCQLLDVQNALIYGRSRPEWKMFTERGARIYEWQPTDPLADILLMQLGAYPTVDDVGIDYRSMFKDACAASEYRLDADAELPVDTILHPSIAYLARHGLKPHYRSYNSWDYPGFFVGDASNLDDLILYWNLRAANNMLWFVDRQHLHRFQAIIPAWKKIVEDELSYRKHGLADRLAVWYRESDTSVEDTQALKAPFGEGHCNFCGVGRFSWNGLNIRPPIMHLGQTTALSVLITESGKPKLAFALGERPYSTDTWFHMQHLAASLSFASGLYNNSSYTLNPPNVPEFNEFISRLMHFHPARIRLESEGLAIVIRATETDTFLYAISVLDLFNKVFDSAGFTAKLSSGGLIARQLVTQLGGLVGAFVFKIPGVRRLLRTFGPTESFTKKAAMQLIAQKDPDMPDVSFKDYENMHIELRKPGQKLQSSQVFTYLVEKGLFRIGAEFSCPNCQMTSWTALDALRQSLPCQMCGCEFDATRQLVDIEWAYRRSGVLGAERNAQGAVPVVLTLQQLNANLGTSLNSSSYLTSIDLTPKLGVNQAKCEVDFVCMINQPFPNRTIVVLAECKDKGYKVRQGEKGDGGTIDVKDIENMRMLADAFPRDRFEVFILLAKLCAFTPQEIELAKTLNDEHRFRVILLSDRELGGFDLYERARKQFEMTNFGMDAKGMARATVEVFFEPKTVDPKTRQGGSSYKADSE